MFTVRDRRPAGIVYMSSVNTYQAYNNFPYDPPAGVGWDEGAHPLPGRSLYDFNSPVTHRYPDGRPAVKVSFDRPYSSQYGNPGNGGLTDFEPFLIAFLEKRGYDVTYITDVDADASPSTLLKHRALIVAGHSEYWSRRMYDGAYAPHHPVARSRPAGAAAVRRPACRRTASSTGAACRSSPSTRAAGRSEALV